MALFCLFEFWTPPVTRSPPWPLRGLFIRENHAHRHFLLPFRVLGVVAACKSKSSWSISIYTIETIPHHTVSVRTIFSRPSSFWTVIHSMDICLSSKILFARRFRHQSRSNGSKIAKLCRRLRFRFSEAIRSVGS